MLYSILASSFLAIALANPIVSRAAPSVSIKNGTIVGSSDGTVDSFKGIPFAEPPVGDLRLKAPRPLSKGYGTLQATRTPRSCPQQSLDTNDGIIQGLPTDVLARLLNTPFFQKVSNAGEDCLTLNVQRPSTATSDSKLPVVFWIYGGGFEVGSTQMYDGATLVKQSMSMKKDVVYVAVNYRVAGFGFLAGKELQKEGNTNLGLRDQRLGLQWVAENIAAFGGDPDKVTIWGESAGAISVFDQTIINRGNNTYKGKALFRGAVMDSGSVVPALEVSNPKPQAIYDTVVRSAGCSGSSDTLACLRSKDYSTFLNAVNSLPGILSYQSLNLAYLPRPDPNDNFFPVSPEEAALNPTDLGVARVPIIIGDQEDEGTLFSLFISNVTSGEKLTDYFYSYFPNADRSKVKGLVDLYPADPSAGSPFRTGLLNELYPNFKRNAAVLGDSTFTLTRRGYLASVAGTVPSWSYLSSAFYGTPILGTFHATDLLSIYYGVLANVQKSILGYYISFFNELDPNALNTGTNWPQWKNETRKLLSIKATGNGVLTDDFRQKQYEYLLANTAQFKV